MKSKPYWEKYKVDVPEGESGIWRVEKFNISDDEAKFYNVRSSIHGGRGGHVQPGNYTRLMRRNSCDNPIMSDTPDEIADHLYPINQAKGHVLINGLGLGVVLNGCLIKKEVEKVTIIELSEDVIKLVEPHYRTKYGNRFEVIHADAFEFSPPKGTRYNMVWSDIWDNICEDNWDSYKKLKRKYCRKSDWYGAWKEDRVKGRY